RGALAARLREGRRRRVPVLLRPPVPHPGGAPAFPSPRLFFFFLARGGGGSPRGGVPRPAALSHLRTLRRRAAPAERARAAVPRSLRPPRIEDIRLVGSRPRPAVSALRRLHEWPPRRAARAHAK